MIKEFENNPDVVAVIYNQGDQFSETREALETLWDNYYLRGGVIFDPTGDNSRGNYGQPVTGIPFTRLFLIDRNGNVALPYFGHDPGRAIEGIYELLENGG